MHTSFANMMHVIIKDKRLQEMILNKAYYKQELQKTELSWILQESAMNSFPKLKNNHLVKMIFYRFGVTFNV